MYLILYSTQLQDIEKFCFSFSNLYSNINKPLSDVFVFFAELWKNFGFNGKDFYQSSLLFSSLLFSSLLFSSLLFSSLLFSSLLFSSPRFSHSGIYSSLFTGPATMLCYFLFAGAYMTK